jgi:hypothetical protein
MRGWVLRRIMFRLSGSLDEILTLSGGSESELGTLSSYR